MKKLIRLFVIIFCLFFALQAMPGSFLPAFRSFLNRAVRFGSETTLLLAEQIDTLTEDGTDGRDRPLPGGTDRTDGERDADKSGADGEKEHTDKTENTDHRNTADKTGNSENTENAENAEKQDHRETAEKAGNADNAENAENTENKKDSESTGKTDTRDLTGTSSGSPDGTDGTAEEPDDAAEEPDVFYYYYTRISKEERLLYDAMLALARDPESGNGEDTAEESRLISLNPAEEAFAESYTRAYNALVTDHPELFWIAQGRARYECRYYVLPSFGGKYKVVLSLDFPSGDSTRAVYAGEEEQLRQAADDLLAEVDLSRSQAAIALQIHDLLIDTAWYNTGAGADDYAHTAYGALVEDSSGNPGGALCDGYALAYEYLLQRAGLTCTMVCGYAGSSEEDNEKHAWNLVLLDEDWYEVDATWDDLDFLLSPSNDGYDLLLEALSDEEYMQRIRHYMFNLTTEQIRSFTPGDEFRYVSYRGWVTLLQPSVHIRFTDQESEETRDYVTPLAPEAFGTWYTWDMLTGNDR